MAEYYISPTGNDANTGAIGSPWKTPQKACNSAVANSTVYAREGVWSGTAARVDTLARDGLKFTNYPGEIASFQDAAQTIPGPLWLVKRSRNFLVEGNAAGGVLSLGLTGAASATTMQKKLIHFRDAGTGGWAGNPGCAVRRVLLDGCNGWGVLVESTTDAIIEDNEIRFCAVGIKTLLAANTVIQRNEIHHQNILLNNVALGSAADAGGSAIDINQDSTNTYVGYNHCYENHAPSQQYGADGGFLDFYQSGVGHVIEWNVVHDNHGVMEGAGDVNNVNRNNTMTFRRNLIYGKADYRTFHSGLPASGPHALLRASRDSVIEHNVWDIDEHGTTGGLRLSDHDAGSYGGLTDGLVIRDNIFRLHLDVPLYYLMTDSFISGWDFDYNLVYYVNAAGNMARRPAAGYSSLAAWQAATPYGDHDIWGEAGTNDPLFVDPANRDYSLQSSSPAINAAHDGTDIGVFDFVGPTGIASDDFSTAGAINGSTADTGGNWTANTSGTSTVTSDGSKVVGTFNQNSAQTIRAALLAVAAQDGEIRFRFKSDKVAVGGGQTIFAMARQTDNDSGYGAQVIMQTSGQVHANFVKRLGGVQTALTTAANTGLPSQVAGTEYWLAFSFEGINPTQLRLKVWRVADAEPAGWTFTTTDSDAALQISDGVGFRLGTGSGTTNQPIVFNLDDFNATEIGVAGGFVDGAANLAGAGSVTPGSVVVRPAAAALAGAAGVTATASLAPHDGSATMAGEATLAAEGNVILFSPPVVVVPLTLAEVLRGNHTPVVRLAFLSTLDTELHVVPGKLLAGSVSSDRTRDQRRAASVSLVNESGLYTPIDYTSLVTPFRLVRIERGALVGGAAQYRPLMTGLLDQPVVSDSSGEVRFTVWSRLRLADRQFNQPYSFAPGTRVREVIRTLAEAGGLGTDDDWYQLSDDGATLSAERAYDVADNILRSMVELSFNHGLELYDDGMGALILKPLVCRFPDCADKAPHPAYVDVALGITEPAWTFDIGLLERERTLNGRVPINRQDVAGVGPDMYPVRASLRDLNPQSPTYNPIDGSGPLGDLPGPPYVSAEIRTQAQANAVAMQLLYERNLADEVGRAEAIPIPFLSAGDVVKFGDAAVLLDQVSIPLGEGSMSMGWRTTRSLTT